MPPLTVDPAGRRPTFATLAALFGFYYFLQGVGEPDDGLMSQPLQSLLTRWGQSVEQIGQFSALLMLPWSIKPLYGLVSDFLPLGGYRRKSYLMLTSGLSAAALFGLSAMTLSVGDVSLLLALLMVPAVGIAFGDVAIDGLMIENGQARGWTGQLQSMQWTGMYAAAALTGIVGGYLSEHRIEQYAILICACAVCSRLCFRRLPPSSGAC